MNEPSHEEYIKLITQSLTHLYGKESMSAPGMIISNLKNGSFYVSLSTYDGAFGKGRRIIYKTQSKNLDDALKDTATFLVTQTKTKNPIEILKKLLEIE